MRAAAFEDLTNPNTRKILEISDREVEILNFYRASELDGGRILARAVPLVREPRLVLELTRQSAEEIVHAHLWAETIVALGGELRPVRDTLQRRFARIVGGPGSIVHVLVATQVLERRAYRHFLEHLRRPGTHRRVLSTLYRMIAEEKHHLTWVKEWLDERALRRGTDVQRIMQRYTRADALLYPALLEELRWDEGPDEPPTASPPAGPRPVG